MLGSTTFVNACIQLRGLAKVAVVRLCGPATHALPPFSDLPPRLREAVSGCWFLASGERACPAHCCLVASQLVHCQSKARMRLPGPAGGYEFDGRSEIAPLDEAQLRDISQQIVAAGIPCIVVSGVFSPLRADQEQQAAAILQAEAAAALRAQAGAAEVEAAGGSSAAAPQQLFVSQSHELGQLGLLERENAAVLNAALLPLAQCVVPACVAALREAGLSCPLYFSGNDGTLLSAEEALKVYVGVRVGCWIATSLCAVLAPPHTLPPWWKQHTCRPGPPLLLLLLLRSDKPLCHRRCRWPLSSRGQSTRCVGQPC